MPEPFKNLYNKQLISTLCREIKKEYGKFDSVAFTKHVFDSDWDNKELKQRMRHISQALHKFLPGNYQHVLEILKPVSSRCSGFEYMFFQDYVELYGLDEYELSIPALEHFTKHASSEFAVRPFIIKYPEKMMAQMSKWASSNNHHVRRLASEGCRPRLPWAMALPQFKTDPQPVIKILTKLKNDENESVRRSVANNLNDISKDNPEIVTEIAKQWSDESRETDRLIKHACRTLLKSGNAETLKLFGFHKPEHIKVENLKTQKSVNMGSSLVFSFMLQSQHGKLGKMRIEYAIDFMKNNGKQARKLFKIAESDYRATEKSVTKKHSFKTITTRKYYAGNHDIAVIVNGHELARENFVLLGANR